MTPIQEEKKKEVMKHQSRAEEEKKGRRKKTFQRRFRRRPRRKKTEFQTARDAPVSFRRWQPGRSGATKVVDKVGDKVRRQRLGVRQSEATKWETKVEGGLLSPALSSLEGRRGRRYAVGGGVRSVVGSKVKEGMGGMGRMGRMRKARWRNG